MNDGTAFNWSNPTEAAAPYVNRDPRFILPFSMMAQNGVSVLQM